MWWEFLLIAIGSAVVLIGLSIIAGRIVFRKKARREAAGLLSNKSIQSASIITEDDIRPLPEPVRKYLRFTHTVGKNRVQAVRLKQKGSFRQGERPWMPFTAEQYYTTDPPGFVWIADMKFLPFLSVKGRDMNYEGKGSMLIKIPPFITIADARGKEIDQGTLVRYLNELMWFPSAYLCDYISWKSIDSNTAEATITIKGESVSATIHFGYDGRMVNFVAQRYYTEGSKSSLETWTTPIKEYGEINGMRLPVKGEGVWELASGSFPYIRLEITDIEYNTRSLF